MKTRAIKQKVPDPNKEASRTETDSLPDYSTDWYLWDAPPRGLASGEIEARFYYEFARESQTILMLAQHLRNFSRGELARSGKTMIYRPYSALGVLHPHCYGILRALGPSYDPKAVGWKDLSAEHKQNLVREFLPRESAFRQLNWLELADFRDDLMRSDETPKETFGYHPKWYGSSEFYWTGVERAVLQIDWNQGPQAVERAMKQWFLKQKKELPKLARAGRLPGDASSANYYFRCRDEQGAKSPRQRYLTALRGLGAMRLLGAYTLKQAISITKDNAPFSRSLDRVSKQPTGRSAWVRGVDHARKVFQDLFFRQDEVSMRFRASSVYDKIGGLPETQEPISYQRYCARR